MLRATRIPLALSLILSLAPAPAAAEPKDKPKCEGKDHPLFTRMPGWYLDKCEDKQFAQFRFPATDAGKRRADQTVEGHLYQYYYRFLDGGPPPSGVQVGRNYANAATAKGGEVLYSDAQGKTTVRFTKDGKQIWAYVHLGGSGLNLDVVEKEAMVQDVTANAVALQGGLEASGHVELTGIYFDSGKSDLKPESDPALAEVGKLLQAQPQLKLWVVGHTDSVGSVESNLALSQARAAAVIRALVERNGVGPQRLSPFGNGPYAPVATNATEEGRAKNRRVELVAR